MNSSNPQSDSIGIYEDLQEPGSAAPLHERIAGHARRTPQALAVSDGEVTLSYAQLEREADRIARRLAREGAGPGRYVALCLSRRPHAIAAMLAVLKTGAAYVPLDPAHPGLRLAMILEDADPVCVLSERALRERLPRGDLAICVDEADEADEAPLPAWVATAHDAVYAIFTSGSTGRPKGVVVERAGLENLVDWYLDYYAVTPSDRLSHLAGQGFDASVYEIWPALAAGASVHLPPEEARLSAAELQRWLLDRRLTVAFAPTLLGEALAECEWPAGTSLRILSTAGEALRRYPSRVLPFAYYNVYGPTECTVVSTTYALPREAGLEGAPPIGRPIANLQVHVLDERLRPLPPGSVGELCIAGVGVARGYLGLPELTAERFVANPFGAGRMYRSGDRARWRADGELEFLGRTDQQVKLRGHRIELGEIETSLLAHAQVSEAVVCLRRIGEEERLVAYVVPHGTAPAAAELHAWLEQRVPGYMVPSAFVSLQRLPLTANGKRDLAALPEPYERVWEQEWEAPATEPERHLAAHWQALLKVSRVGRSDDFFVLGGHSLLAMQLCVRLREDGWELPVRAVFEARTLSAQAGRLEQAVPATRSVIARADRTRPLPLSPVQRGLWFLEQLHPASAFYHVPIAVDLEGALDATALRASLEDLLARHEALRTGFRETADGAMQVVQPEVALDFAEEDLRSHDVDVRESIAASRTAAHAAEPFRLGRAPLWRARLYRLGGERYRLLLVFHHLIIDGASFAVFARELGAFYAARRAGSAPPIDAAERADYADFAQWSASPERAAAREDSLSYWAGQLAGVPALELPLDRPRSDRPRRIGGVERFALDRRGADAVERLARRQATTPFVVLLATLQILLGRYSGQTDFAIGTPAANRARAEFDSTIGVFINTLALRADLSGNPDVGECLRRTQATLLEALARQDVPFDDVVAATAAPREAGRHPLFQAMLVLQPAPATQLALPGLVSRDAFVHAGTSRFDLLLTFSRDENGFEAALEYDAELFDAATVRAMAGQFPCLLEAMAADPACTISQLEFLPPSQHQRLLEDCNGPERDYDLETTLAERLARQAARTPSACALRFEGDSLDYAELDRRASALAARLHRCGVRPGTFVGVCMERSFDLVVALVGVLKAGGAYVPLDPDYPRERLAFMANDAAFPVLLTQASLSSSLPPFAGALEIVDAGLLDEKPAQEPLPCAAGPDDPAYMIYTSGSTGRPKGAIITHRAICNRLLWMQEAFALGAGERILQKTPCGFDVSVWEFFWPLMVGATLVIARPGGHRDSRYLARVIEEERISTLHFVPSMLQAFLQEERIDRLDALRRVIVSGEALPPALVQRFQQRLRAELHNLYGPTEAAVDVSWWPCPPDWDGTNVPIGRPIANTQLYVMNEAGRLQPPGVPGELCIGGVQVARGYHDRAELTAQKFVVDPFRGGASRLYRTGDLVRHAPDGQLLFLGRLDHQVKIRGQRVELGEIEAQLGAHAEVDEACVTALDDGTGNLRLVAYVVPPAGAAAPSPEALVRFLAAGLPAHMLPAHFVTLPAMPLSPNGKLDRKALPAPEVTNAVGAAAHVAPRTPQEEIMALVWCEVLRLPEVSIDASFFDLGGDSIRVLEVRNLAEARGLPFALELIFRHPTIRGLIAALSDANAAACADAPSSPFEQIQAAARKRLPDGLDDAFPATLLQTGMLFHTEMEHGVPIYHDVFRYEIAGAFDAARFARALGAVAQRHPALRSAFLADADGGYVQAVRTTCEIPLTVEDLSGCDAQQVSTAARAWLEAEKQRPFDLARAPLLRLHVQRLSPVAFALGLGFHHAILDGWSVASFVAELLHAFATGESIAPPPAGGLGAYARLERDSLESTVSRDYWQRQLAGWREPAQSLAVAGGRMDEAASVEIDVGADTLERLRRVSRAAAVPLKTALLAAHLVLMKSLGGSDDVLTGLVSSGRPELAGGERLLGLFLNVLPLRCAVGAASWIELLREVFARERESFAHRRYPLARIQQDRGGGALLETVFNFVHFHVFDRLAEVRPVAFEGFEMTNFPLAVNAYIDPLTQGLRVRLIYQTRAFEPSVIARVAARYRRLLEQLAYAPQDSIAQVDLLLEQDRADLQAWNRTRVVRDGSAPLHERIAAHARRTPQALAVSDGEVTLSYAQLEREADRIARRLAREGAGPGRYVALCLSRRPHAIAAMLAVLKTGAAYVPLDPAHPGLRLAMILEDADPVCVLSERALRERLPRGDLAICADEADEAPLPAWVATAHDAVYAIFTSGSTGRPKGVVVERAGLENLVDWYLDYYAVTPSDRLSHLAGQGFDASVYEIWPALAAGASVHLPPEEARLSAAELQRWLLDRRLTVAFAPTLLGEALAECEWPAGTSLRILSTAGEALRRYPSRVLPFAYYNVYGPTECTVVSTTYALPREAGLEGAPPIGRPIANLQVHVLDEQLRPLPPGSVGELCIAGIGVARGYLGLPELTAERFVANPFGAGRMYRSGDRARWRADGELEFLGRTDQQVKLRGHRIELGEIETSLLAHAQVSEAVVCLRRTGEEERLVAYVVPHGTAPTAAQLHAWLEQRVPGYMVPSAFVSLQRLPLTANGKRDLAALPEPQEQLPAEDWEAPATESERRLAAHWRALLKVSRVGRSDDFFVLGGHSLLAMQLCVRLREDGWELPVRAVFEARTLSAQAGRLEQAVPAMRSVIARADRTRPVPLSPVQRGLWFLDRLEGPGARTYLVPEAFRLEGRLDRVALERALRELVHRHESLRSAFPPARGEAAQAILDPDRWSSAFQDLSPLPPAAREAAMRRRLQDDAQTGFDLAAGMPFRATLLRLGDDDHVLLLNVHHIVCDGWSMGVLHRELGELYAAFAQARTSPLAPLPLQYADYTQWMHERLTPELCRRQLDYWRAQLEGRLGALDLPLDFPRPALPSFDGRTVAFSLPAPLAARLRAACAAQGATLFTGALAAFSVLLARHTGQDDVVVGTPTANRPQRELEGLIGFFVNTLAMRVRLDGEPGFAQLIDRVRRVALDAYEHADVPFASVVEALGAAAARAPAPPLQAMLIVQNPADAPLPLPGLASTPLRPTGTVAKFDLTLSLQEAPDGSLQGEFEYATSLFTHATVEAMAERFACLLDALLHEPDAPVHAAAMLPERERRQVTQAFNATATEYPSQQSVHALFREQARRNPQAPALVCGDRVLSYAELDLRSDAMAARLRGLGVGAESCVGVLAERSPQTIVALLAVLKAGGAYQPIDPATPPARVARLLEDARTRVLLTQRALLDALPPYDGSVRCLDEDAADWPDAPLPEDGRSGPRRLAYVMHTSGSTGEPKGVMIEHRAVVRLVRGADYVDFGGRQTFLSLAPLAFDASTFEIWGALLNGHALAVASPQRLSADEIGALLTQHRVTTLWLTAGLFHLLVDHRLEAFAGLRQLIAGGDVLSPAHVRRLRTAHPHIRLVNGYGPTENTTFSCCYEVPEDFGAASVPIGRPIANTRAYVLDRRGEPVPVGVRGELYVGGDGLARGYLGRADLSAERFVADPFGADPQARLYRTGDEARWLADGTLEFFGRRDQQLKLRGYRIEPAEIEAALVEHPDVREASVLAREDVPGERRLVAYVVAEAAASPDAERLRAFLRERLPDYMIPAAVVALAALPLTPNGKVDRRALPAPLREQPDAFVAPSGREEIALAEAWREALQCGPVSADDHFFELGGHSLAAVKAVALAADALGVSMPVNLIFRHPVLRDLAAQLRGEAPESAGAAVVPLRSRGTQLPVFCFHALFGTVLFYADLVRELGEDQPAYGLQTPGLYGEETPQRDLDGVVAAHLASIRRLQPQGPYRLIGYCMGGVLALESARRLQAQGETVECLVLIDSFHAPAGAAPPPTEPDALLHAFALDMVERGGGDPREAEARFVRLGGEQRVAFAMDWAARAGVLPPDVADATAFLAWMHASAANATAYLTHVAAPYDGRVLFLRAQERSVDALESWDGTFGAALQLIDVPGDHASMIEPPHVGALAAHIRAALADAAQPQQAPPATRG